MRYLGEYSDRNKLIKDDMQEIEEMNCAVKVL
jgi:hypothetical protein